MIKLLFALAMFAVLPDAHMVGVRKVVTLAEIRHYHYQVEPDDGPLYDPKGREENGRVRIYVGGTGAVGDYNTKVLIGEWSDRDDGYRIIDWSMY
jgi:hypothetical protein